MQKPNTVSIAFFKNINFNKNKDKYNFMMHLALLKIKDRLSFNNLIKSTGFHAIINGKLSPEYIKNLNSDKKISYNYFYELFDELEKNTKNRLAKIKNLNKRLAIKYIKAIDKDICKSPEVLENFLAILEKNQNIELINTILEKQNKNVSINYTKSLIDSINTDPETVKKVLDLPQYNSKKIEDLYYATTTLLEKNNKIDDELFEYLKKNNFCEYLWLSEVNIFLDLKGADKELLKTYLTEVSKLKDNITKRNALYNISEDNIEYLKHCIKNNQFNTDTIYKLAIMNNSTGKDPKNWELIDKIYEKTFLPLHKAYAGEHTKIAYCFAKLHLKNPKKVQKIKDTGFFELIKQKKIHLGALNLDRLGTPSLDVLKDLLMYIEGKSIIKKFPSLNRILEKTQKGDVMSVNGKMYLNNNGALEPWNMTERTFNKLFPLINRFVGHQGYNDCFLISTLDNIYRNPVTRGNYYKMFEQKGNDIFVTIPAYKDFNGTVKFPNGKIKLTSKSSRAAKHIQMLEQAYARVALCNSKNTPMGKDSLTTKDLNYLHQRINVGILDNTLIDFLNILVNSTEKQTTIQLFTPCANIIEFKEPDTAYLSSILYGLRESNKIIQATLKQNKKNKPEHVISLEAFNPETKKIKAIDPNFLGFTQEYDIEELGKNLHHLCITLIQNLGL